MHLNVIPSLRIDTCVKPWQCETILPSIRQLCSLILLEVYMLSEHENGKQKGRRKKGYESLRAHNSIVDGSAYGQMLCLISVVQLTN